ncbi:MAG: hypothetical protein ACPK85_15735 [Methanosarcina sp.]
MTHSSSSLSPYFKDLIDLLGVVEHRIHATDILKEIREKDTSLSTIMILKK